MIKFCAKLFLLNEYPSLFAILQILQMGDFNIFLQKMYSMQACHEPLGIYIVACWDACDTACQRKNAMVSVSGCCAFAK